MDKLKDKRYWQLILMRALKTFVQTLISTAGITAVTTLTDLMTIDWKYCLIASLGAGILSLVNNIIGTIPEYDDMIIYERKELPKELYDPEEDSLYNEWKQTAEPIASDEEKEEN